MKAAVWGSGESWSWGRKSLWPPTSLNFPPHHLYAAFMEPLGLQQSILTLELDFYLELLHSSLNYTFHISQLRTAALALKMSITHLLWPEEKKKTSALHFYFLPPPPRLYISLMCIVTGLCEYCIKFWSQCETFPSSMWPEVRIRTKAAVMRSS